MTVDVFEPTALLGFAEEIWESYFGDLPEMLPPGPEPISGVSASVSIVGPWNGVVVVTTTAAGAARVAACLLALPVEDVSSLDVDDAIGELVNIVGGNVKSVMPGPGALSLPVVAQGRVHLGDSHAVQIAELLLSWRGELVELAVWTSRRPGR